MTIEVQAPGNNYTVMGTGPYAAGWPYVTGAVKAVVIKSGVRTALVEGVDFTMSPASSKTTGDLTLSAAAAAAHDAGTIYLSRATLAQQGWLGTLGEREKGLEGQLDILTMRAQEVGQVLTQSLRADTDLAPIVPVPNTLMIFDEFGQPTTGPTIPDIAAAQGNAAIATAKAAEAQASAALAAAQVGLAANQVVLAGNQVGLAAAQVGLAANEAAAAATSAAEAALYATIGGSEQSYLLNTDFRIWERNAPLGLGGVFSGNGYGGPDLWINAFSGGTVQMTRPTFAAGTQLGIADPRVYLQQQVSGQTLAADFAYISQRITPVDRYQGRQITLTGWAMLPDGAGNIAVSAVQHFGSGGAPSASVNIAAATVAIGTSFQKFKATLIIPSIAGKVRGTNDDEYLEFRIWNSAGATQDALTGALGLHNRRLGLFGLEVHLGDVAATAADNFKLVYPGRTLSECQRYFQLGETLFEGAVVNGVPYVAPVVYSTPFRKVPNLSVVSFLAISFSTPPAISRASKAGFWERRFATATNTGSFQSTWQGDAQL